MGVESRLLYDERPLVVIPELAVVVGLNNAIALQQVHYWVRINQRADKNFRAGYYWTYNTYENWREQFPFWSISTIKRIFMLLEADGLIVTGSYNRLPIDRTKWYRINYDRLAECVKLIQWSGQSDTLDGSKRPIGRLNLTSPLPEIKTEITTDSRVIEIWTESLELLKDQVSKPNFRTWLKDVVPLSFDGEAFVVAAQNTFVAEYLNVKQRSLVEKTLTEVVGEPVIFVCQVMPVTKPAETINDKIRDLLNAGREITGEEKTDQAIAFLDEEQLDEEQLEAWFKELTDFTNQGKRTEGENMAAGELVATGNIEPEGNTKGEK